MLPLSEIETLKIRRWTNWSGSVASRPLDVAYPRSQDDVVALVQRASKAGRTLRVVGSGHSFTPLVATEGHLLSLDRMQGIEAVDRDARQATVLAGTKLKALGAMLHEQGLGQENLGDIDVQSVAGALSTGTHGTGTGLGTLATQVREISFVNGSGEVVTCSESRDRDVFKAAQVSFGSLGVLTRVKLQLLPAYKLKLVKGKEGLEEVIGNLERHKAANRNFEFFWFPYSDKVATKLMNATEEAPREGGFGKYVTDVVLENWGFQALSSLCRVAPPLSRSVSRLSAAAVSTGEDVNWSHRIYATPRLVRFQEMEYNVPAASLPEVLREIRRTMEEKRFRVHFPIEVRFVKRDDIWLSPAYERESAYVAVHVYKGMEHRPYFEAMERIFRSHQGRPHWGKMHTLTAKDFSKLYPMWDRFQEIRRRMDPHGVFLNEHLRRVHLGSG